MTNQLFNRKSSFVSLRLKLLLGFTVLFSGVFAAAFYWFYSFATEKSMNRLFEDMRDTASGTAEMIDVDQVLDLYRDGQASADPDALTDDPSYKEQLALFRLIHDIEPRAWPYTFLVVDGDVSDPALVPGTLLTNRADRPPVTSSQTIADLQPGQTLPTVFLGDLWVYYDAAKAADFLEVSTASEYTLQTYREGKMVERPLYDDGQFGSWISAYFPLKDASGQTVAILGIDFEADYVREVQQAIKDKLFIAFGITYGSLFVLVYLLSGIFAKPIVGLTKVAERIGEGHYDDNLDDFKQQRLPDEIGTLAEVFAIMISKVRQREETLKQQVAELKIEIDETKRKKQVSEIVDSDFFQDLQTKANQLRRRSQDRVNTNIQAKPDETTEQ